MNRHRRISALVALPLAAGLLVGCDLYGEPPTFGRGIKVTNNSVVELSFQAMDDDEPVRLPGSVGPGESGILIEASMLTTGSRFGTNGCTSVEIVAFGLDGDEVERVEPPLCVGEEWIVGTSR